MSLRLACATASALKAVQQPEDLFERRHHWAPDARNVLRCILGAFAGAGRGLYLRIALALQLVRKGVSVLETGGPIVFLSKARRFLYRGLGGLTHRVRLDVARLREVFTKRRRSVMVVPPWVLCKALAKKGWWFVRRVSAHSVRIANGKLRGRVNSVGRQSWSQVLNEQSSRTRPLLEWYVNRELQGADSIPEMRSKLVQALRVLGR